MPHRPERPGGAGTASATASSIFKQHNTGSATMQTATASHIIRPTAQSAVVYPGVVTPLLSSIGSESQKPWLAAHPGMINRPMMPTKSTDSADNRSTSTKHDEDCTVATLATEATADELERREATASALLLVGQTPRVEVSNLEDGDEKDDPNDGQEISTVPLKKRKKHLDFLRKNQETESSASKQQDPCHVSPMSHSSIGSTRVDGRTVSKEEVTPDRPFRQSNVADRTSSFDSKESPFRPCVKGSTQALLDSSKIMSTTDIAPPAHVVVPHFPSVLHQVLSGHEFGDTVLQWLPDGESWKVLRWDALRRQVLPKYFSDLRDEHGGGSGTIDAFLWHLTAWGFEEVKDGTDVGAYRHDLFIRGAQKLCSKMRFTAVPSDEHKALGPNTVSPGRVRVAGDRTMLQVPSLNAIARPVAEKDVVSPESPNKRPRFVEPGVIDGLRRLSPGPLGWPMSYRPGDHYSDAGVWSYYYTESSQVGIRQGLSHFNGSSYDPRLHLRHVASDPISRHTTQYAPPQVRSGRGSLRVSNARSSADSSPGNTTPSRPSFPVSNRGKGSRKTSVCRRSSTPTAPSSAGGAERSSPVENSIAAEAHRVGTAVQGLAVAISRRSKRKLPMASKQESEVKVSGETKSES